jgi:hypothetical protein
MHCKRGKVQINIKSMNIVSNLLHAAAVLLRIEGAYNSRWSVLCYN